MLNPSSKNPMDKKRGRGKRGPDKQPRKPVTNGRCTARISSGERRCRRSCVKGTTVCATHGGSAAHVKRAGLVRLDDLAHVAIAQLAELLEQAKKADDKRSYLKAIVTVLDRTGYGPSRSVDLSGKVGIDGKVAVEHSTFDVATLPLEVQMVLMYAKDHGSIPDRIKAAIGESLSVEVLDGGDIKVAKRVGNNGHTLLPGSARPDQPERSLCNGAPELTEDASTGVHSPRTHTLPPAPAPGEHLDLTTDRPAVDAVRGSSSAPDHDPSYGTSSTDNPPQGSTSDAGLAPVHYTPYVLEI